MSKLLSQFTPSQDLMSMSPGRNVKNQSMKTLSVASQSAKDKRSQGHTGQEANFPNSVKGKS